MPDDDATREQLIALLTKWARPYLQCIVGPVIAEIAKPLTEMGAAVDALETLTAQATSTRARLVARLNQLATRVGKLESAARRHWIECAADAAREDEPPQE